MLSRQFWTPASLLNIWGCSQVVLWGGWSEVGHIYLSFFLFVGSCCLAGFFSRKLQPTTYAICIATLQAGSHIEALLGVSSYSSCVLFKTVTLSMASSDASMSTDTDTGSQIVGSRNWWDTVKISRCHQSLSFRLLLVDENRMRCA